MRRVILLAVAAACAQPGAPPGGPPDPTPPAIVRITPDSNALNVRADAVTFVFDEVVSERPQGVGSLAELFIVSPSEGLPEISWRRTRVSVAPRGGFRRNTTYSIEMLPGLTDLESNADSVGRTIVFSTGPRIDSSRIAGRVFDWAQARPAANAFVEAVALPDSGRYATAADSAGGFTLRNLAPGRYLLRAIVDANRNRVADGREIFDTATVEVRDSLRREMLAALRDSLGPGISAADARDSLLVRVGFDRPLDTLFVATPAVFSLKSADSAIVPIDAVLTQAQIDSATAAAMRREAAADSARRAAIADSLARADTTGRARAQPPPTPPPTARRPGVQIAIPAATPGDTAGRPPRPGARIPVTTLFLRLQRPLAAGTSYRLSGDSLRSVTGATRSSSRVFATPRATTDTGAVRPDTGGPDHGGRQRRGRP